ncbi:MAG TPA: ATP-binding protein [Candidatus Methanoperedenaceae archaeon]|nr:ATP-binding protein [Candidatus Methanoperedenaceae archaeon]
MTDANLKYYAAKHNVMVHNVPFIDREDEIAFLNEAYSTDRSQMIILYGRRRVGKTYLLLEFMKEKKHTYHLCTRGNETEQIRFLSRMVGVSLDDTALVLSPFSEWRTLFMYLYEKAKDERYLLIIDEFPYLITANSAVTSIFQKYWDEYLSKTKMMLVLCGSSIAMMESEVLAYNSPLYGRMTGQWKVEPMSFGDAASFFAKGRCGEEAIENYSITGGVPFYLVELDLTKSAIDNILENVARKGRLLYDEGEILIREELRDPSTYFSILEAISSGNAKQVRIANRIGVPSTALPRYLSTLMRLGYIEKRVPVTEPGKSKKAVYRIKDNFMNFWFRFIYPYRSYIEEGDYERFREILDRHFNLYVSFIFEDVCKDFLNALNRSDRLPLHFTKIGNWWGHYRDRGMRREVEIDVVALNDATKEILFVECKWRNLSRRQAETILGELSEKSRHVDWNDGVRTEYFGIIGKRIEGKDELRGMGFIVFDLDDF